MKVIMVIYGQDDINILKDFTKKHSETLKLYCYTKIIIFQWVVPCAAMLMGQEEGNPLLQLFQPEESTV